MTPPDCPAEKHGTVHAYNHYSCRCPVAVQAKSRQEKRRQLAILRTGHGLWIDGTGVSRRLRALCAMGHNTHTLAAELGTSQPQVRRWLRGGTQVHVTTLERVKAVYDRLSMVRGSGPRAARTIRWAQRQGFLVPLAYDDDRIDDPTYRPARDPRVDEHRYVDPIAVEEALAGRPVKLTVHERREVVRRLHALVYGGTEIAARLGITYEAARRLGSRTRLHDREVAA